MIGNRYGRLVVIRDSGETATLRKQREEARKAHRALRDIERKQRAIMNGLLEG